MRTAPTNLKPGRPEAVTRAVADALKNMDAIQSPAGAAAGLRYRPPVAQRIGRLLNTIDSYALAPTNDQ